MKRITVIDSHTGGEPSRLVTAGFPSLGQEALLNGTECSSRNTPHSAAHACILEPRGNDILVGALLCEPADPSACAGVIFFNNSGYLGVCRHGTIGLAASLAYAGQITHGIRRIETPVGTVQATLHEDLTVSVRNVPFYRYRKDVTLSVPGCGEVTGDVVWGGNWVFLINDHNLSVANDNLELLTAYASSVQNALDDQGIWGSGRQQQLEGGQTENALWHGACQGRVCGGALEHLFGWTVGAPRPPLNPVRIETLIKMASAKETL